MNRAKPKIRVISSREEKRAEKRKARTAQREALAAQRVVNQPELDKSAELIEWKHTRCHYCFREVEPRSSISIGTTEKACLNCVKEFGEETIQRDMVRNHKIWENRQLRNNKALKQCPNCNEYREKSNYSLFWTGKKYTDVCKICTDTCGETEIRDNLVYHKGTAPFMAGGLPTLGKKR